jgi:hypothetical protein
MPSTEPSKFSSRTVAFGNIVGITLKGTLWQVETPPTVWKRIKRQLDAQQRKDKRYQAVRPEQTTDRVSNHQFQ